MNKYEKMKRAYKKGGVIADMLVNANASSLASSFLCKVEEVMEREKITRKKLAELIGVNSSYITRVFNDDTKLNFTLLAKIEIVLGIEFENARLKYEEQYTDKDDFVPQEAKVQKFYMEELVAA